VLRRQPIIGLDYLMDTLMTEVKALDTAAVFASGIPLYAVAARLPDYDISVLSDFESGDDLRNALRASARIPVASGAPVQIDGVELLDGSMVSSIPAETAVGTLGATHLVALLTRPVGELRGKPTFAQRRFLFPLMNRMLSGLGDATSRRAPRYAAELEYLNGFDNSVVVQLPADSPPIRQLDQNPNALFEAAAAGAAEVYRTFTGRTRRFYPGLALYPEQ
jgi:predicted patatin/cPLA2 family phospholipase